MNVASFKKTVSAATQNAKYKTPEIFLTELMPIGKLYAADSGVL